MAEKKKGFWSRILGGKDEPEQKTDQSNAEDQALSDDAPDTAAVPAGDQPLEHEKMVEAAEGALDRIEEDLEQAPDADPRAPEPAEAAEKAVKTVEAELQEVSELEQAANAPSEPEPEPEPEEIMAGVPGTGAKRPVAAIKPAGVPGTGAKRPVAARKRKAGLRGCARA